MKLVWLGLILIDWLVFKDIVETLIRIGGY